MSRLLVINWNARTLRYVHADADRQGRLRLVDAGQDELSAEGETNAAVVTGVQQLVARLKADKSRILILMNRGSVDSAIFTVPPAIWSPAIVNAPVVVAVVMTFEMMKWFDGCFWLKRRVLS